MVSLNMPRYSFILTTTLLFCVLVVVTGRSVENELHLPEGIEFDTTNIDDEDDVEARYMSSGSGSGLSSSTIESILKQIMSLFEDQGAQQPNIIIVPLGGGGGSSTGYGTTGSGSGGSLPAGQIIQAALPEIITSAVAGNSDTTRRRRRRRRRPVNVNRRVNQNRRRRPNGRRVFVLRSSDTQ